jgi:peroxiredoxin
MNALAERKARSYRGRLLGYLAQAALLVLVYVGISAWQTRGHLASGAAIAPDFQLQSLAGPSVRLADLRGKSVVLHFWATWCDVCKLEIGSLNALSRALKPDQVLISVVADADDAARVRAFVGEYGINYPVLLADDRVISAYAVGAFPTTYFLTPDGKIASTSVGLSNRFAYRARLGCAR